MNEKIEAARAAVEAMRNTPAWAAADAVAAVLDAVEALAGELAAAGGGVAE